MKHRMFIQPLLSIPVSELLKLWSELVEAYHGVNGFGGSVAEIYAYRVQHAGPFVQSDFLKETKLGKQARRDMLMQSIDALIALVEEFCEVYQCEARIDGNTLPDWQYIMHSNGGFSHRAHVEIFRDKKR